MTPHELCKIYEDLLSRKDLAALEALFVPGAMIKAPLSGLVPVRQFHTYLFSSTYRTAAKFGNIIRQRDKPCSITTPFNYTLSIESGDATFLYGTTTFDIDDACWKFRSITFEYDATELRFFMERAGIPLPEDAHGA